MAVSRDDLAAIEKNLLEIERRRTYDKLAEYAPFPKQLAFHALTRIHTQSCFGAGNQLGKTFAGAAQASIFLTGRYPKWWPGRKWDRPTVGTVLGNSAEATRDTAQRLLLGRETEGYGTGLLPADCLDRATMKTARGVSGVFDIVPVKHESGINQGAGRQKWSELKFKSYEKGRAKLQGDTIDWFWEDEEPPQDVHDELLARITATRGCGWLTFTPLEGITGLVAGFYDEPGRPRLVTMRIDESPLFTPEMIEEQKKKYPVHQWQARLYGEPMQGEGAVFTFNPDSIACDPFPIPREWAQVWGMDFGTGHPFAASLLAHDREADIIYVVHSFSMADTLPLQHAEAMKRAASGCGGKIPAVWPQDGTQRKEYDGKLEPLAHIYKRHGVKMHHEHCKWEDGSNSTEAGILDMQERMATGRLKVFRQNLGWFKEYGRYHRKDGLLVKINDDEMSATRVGVMGIRFARPVFYHPNTPDGKPPVQMAVGYDWSPI
jgi:phage terminase large subunit-like protein